MNDYFVVLSMFLYKHGNRNEYFSLTYTQIHMVITNINKYASVIAIFKYS